MYVIAREIKFGPINGKIQNPGCNEHIQNNLRIANADSDQPEIMSLATNLKVQTRYEIVSDGILENEQIQPNKLQALLW